MLNKIKNFSYGFILVHLLWLYGTHFVNDRLIPSPFIVYTRVDVEFLNQMVLHVGYSLWRLFLGLSISIVLGLCFGLLMARSKAFGRLLNPLMYFLYPIPKMAFLPVVMLTFGLGNPTTIAMIVLIIVFQMMVNVRDGIISIPAENYHTLITLGANRWQLFKDITFPAALSQILSGARVALGTATAILFITETHGTRHGMGFYIMDAFNRINYVDMYAGIVILSLMAFILFLLIDTLDAILLKWAK